MDVRIFIIHSWSKPDDYNDVVAILKNSCCFCCINYSLQRKDFLYDGNPNESVGLIKKTIIKNIFKSDIVIVVPGLPIEKNGWRMFEIRISNHFNKPVIYLSKQGVIPNSIRNLVEGIIELNDEQEIISEIFEIMERNSH